MLRILALTLIAATVFGSVAPQRAYADSKTKTVDDGDEDDSESDTGAPVKKPKPAPSRRSHANHEFQHNYEHPMLQYQNAGQECFYGGLRGAFIGLGTGLAVQLVGYGLTGREMRYGGRVTSAAVGLGFLTGAVLGYVGAENNNDRVRLHEDSVLEKYGSLTPSVFTGSSLASTGFGLTYSLKFN